MVHAERPDHAAPRAAATALEGLDGPEMGAIAYPDYTVHTAVSHTPSGEFAA